MLEIGAGDEAEHAILLCNYLLHFNRRAWVVLGRGVPEGKTAYVLMEEGGYAFDPKTRTMASPFVLIQPTTGHHYAPTDSHCTLTDVGCIFNHENVCLIFALIDG